MSDAPLPLIDRAALLRHRARAARLGSAPFPLPAVIAEMQERLAEVNKTFTAPAIVTPWPEVWRAAFPGARVIDDSPELDLVPAAHDLVIHALCLHQANDPVGQIIQCRRALRPDGLFLAALFGGESLQELRAALTAAEVALKGGLSPRFLPLADLRDWGALLTRAGLALPVADRSRQTVLYPSLPRLFADLRALGEQSALSRRPRHFAPRALFTETAARYTGAPEGPLPATLELIWLTAWAPAPGQPQPLRPGSAQKSLAEALGTRAFSLPADHGAPKDEGPDA